MSASAAHIRPASRGIVLALLLALLCAATASLLAPGAAGAATPGGVSGKVTAAATGAGIGGVEVTAYRMSESGPWAWAAKTTTRADGSYKITRLDAGSYKIGFSDPSGLYASLYYGSTREFWESPTFEVSDRVVPGIDVALPDLAHLVGAVVGTDGAPLPGIRVTVYHFDYSVYEWVTDGTALSDGDGHYDVAGLLGGSQNLVEFSDPHGVYATQFPSWYGDVPLRDFASWQDIASESVTTLDATMRVGGSVSGAVTSQGSPVSGGRVTLWIRPFPGWGWAAYGETTTDTAGHYAFAGLFPAEYAVGFGESDDGFMTEFYDDAGGLDDATMLALAEGLQVSEIDADLAPDGTPTALGGKVTDAGGAGLPDVTATLYRISWGYPSYVRDVTTGADGGYLFDGLDPGVYRVSFADGAGQYLPESYDDADDVYAATDVRVAPGATVTGVDAVLARASHIKGVVHDPGGLPLAGIQVNALEIDEYGQWRYSASTWTGEDGTYAVAGLAAGDYAVEFVDPSGVYAYEVWNDRDNWADAVAAGDAIVVGDDETVPGIDATLDAKSVISGTVRAPAAAPATEGEPLQDIHVSLFAVGDWGYMYVVADTTTDAAGAYRFTGLDATTAAQWTRSYRLQFWDSNWRFMAEWYDDAGDGNATDVALPRSTEVVLNDAVLDDNSSAISGSVTSSMTGLPLGDISVDAYRLRHGEWEPFAWTATDSLGGYAFAGLPAGTYRLGFNDWSGAHSPEFFDDKRTLETAEDVVLAWGETRVDVDAALEPPTRITGRLLDADGDLIAGEVWVYAHDVASGEWQPTYWGTTDRGAFDLRVEAGTYKVQFASWSASWNPTYWEFYDGASDLEHAATVEVDVGEAATLGDIVLPLGHIEGAVTDAGGPRPWTYVSAWRLEAGEWQYVGETSSGSRGVYDLGSLPEGTYKVRFWDWQDWSEGPVTVEYYEDRSDLETADEIVLGPGERREGIDAYVEYSHVRGTVRDAATFLPLAGVQVTAYHRYSWGDPCKMAVTTTDALGQFDIGGLLPGTFQIGFDDLAGPLVAQYYDGAYAFEDAADVTVGLGESVTLEHDTLLTTGGGAISGQVIGDSGLALDGITVEVWTARWYSEYSETYPRAVVKRTTTASDGTYVVTGLAEGRYAVKFVDGGEGLYVAEWFLGQRDDEWSYKDPVWVTNGETHTGVDASLEPGGRITGTVTDAQGAPLPVPCSVRAESLIGGWWSHAEATVSPDGTYRLTGLMPGEWRVTFYPDDPFVWEEWPDGHRYESGETIAVIGGQSVDGVDARLSAGPTSISGRVGDATGDPLEHVMVTAYYQRDDGEWTYAADTSTNATGGYRIDHLWDGTYKVRLSRASFEDGGGLVTEWWRDAPDRDAATPVVIAVGARATGISARMEPADPEPPSLTTTTQLAVLEPGAPRPPDDSSSWFDASSPPGPRILMSGEAGHEVYSRMTVSNTGPVNVEYYYREVDGGDWYGGAVSTGETRMEDVYPGHQYELYWWANDDLGRQWVTDWTPVGPFWQPLSPWIEVHRRLSTTGDPSGEWFAADSPEAALSVLTGTPLYAEITVINVGNVALSGVTVADCGATVADGIEIPCDDPDTWWVHEGVWTTIVGPYTTTTGLHDETSRAQATVTDDLGATWHGDVSDTTYYAAEDVGLDLTKEIGLSADGPWYDDALPVADIFGLAGTEVYYRVTVDYRSARAVSGVTVTDLRNTPDDPSDDATIGTFDIAPGEGSWSQVLGPFRAVTGSYTNWAGARAVWDGGEAEARDEASYATVYSCWEGGYWKTHPADWAPTGYVPYASPAAPATTLWQLFYTTQLYTYKTKRARTLDKCTVMNALGLSGGQGLDGAAWQLVRVGAAAMLNAKYAEAGVTPAITYPFPPGYNGEFGQETVAGKVNTALYDAKQTGDVSILTDLTMELQAYNRGLPPW